MVSGGEWAPPLRTPLPCLSLRPRAPLERFALSVAIMEDGVVGAALPRTSPRPWPPASCAARALRLSVAFWQKPAKCKDIHCHSHARTQKERVPEDAESYVFPMSFHFFTRPQGARTPGRPRHANPGLRPYIPSVKNAPPSNY